jgi:hypothetical protein
VKPVNAASDRDPRVIACQGKLERGEADGYRSAGACVVPVRDEC